jgi:UPF0716 protein FxsA
VFRWLALIFLVVPFVELWILLRVGSWIGFWPTVAVVLAEALVGAWLAKREGIRVLRDWQAALAQMRLPDEGITSSLLVLVGAVLLATPGFISDIVGMLFLIPATRKVAAGLIETYVKKRLDRGGSVFDVRVVTPRGAYGRRRVVDVEGEVVEDRELHARAPEVRTPQVRTEVVEGVLEGEVVDSSMRRLGAGSSTPE